MIILGIDPGTRRIGYGVIEVGASLLQLRDAGILPILSNDHFGAMEEVRAGINRIVKKFRPSVVAVERIYFSKNRKTGIQVAEMRGVIISTLLAQSILVEEYSPNEVKSAVTGYGFADKKSVLKMVRLILKEPDLALIDDASDALAIAIIAGMKKRA